MWLSRLVNWICICSVFVSAENLLEWAGVVQKSNGTESSILPLGFLSSYISSNVNTTEAVTEAPSDPRFMMEMLTGKEKNWSFKRKGLFGTHNVAIKIGAQESMFCRMMKRQSVMMFSFCMQNKGGQNQGWGQSSTTASSGWGMSSTTASSGWGQMSTTASSGWGMSSSTPSSNEGWGQSQGGKKKGNKKKGGKKKKNKGGKGQDQSQGQGWGEEQQMDDQDDQETSVQTASQNQKYGENFDDEIEDTEVKVQIHSPMSSSFDSPDEMMQMGVDDVETKTDTPSSSSSESQLSNIGKPKIVVKSETSIASLYEIDLNQWKIMNKNGQMKAKIEDMVKNPPVLPEGVIGKHYYKTGDVNFDIQNLRHFSRSVKR